MDDRPPDTVKALLVELKDASELMVDLAYAAVFFNEEKLAEEVMRLDTRSAGHLRRQVDRVSPGEAVKDLGPANSR